MDRRLAGLGRDLDVLLGERLRLRDQRHGSRRHEHGRREDPDQDQRDRRHVKKEAAGLQLGRRFGQEPRRGRRDAFALPPFPDGRRRLDLGRDALALRTHRAKDGESRLGGHLLHRRVVANDRDALAQASRVVAQELEVETTLPDARTHRQDEHRVLAVVAAQALDELGDLFFGFDVNRVRCHGVYRSPGGLLRLL